MQTIAELILILLKLMIHGSLLFYSSNAYCRNPLPQQPQPRPPSPPDIHEQSRRDMRGEVETAESALRKYGCCPLEIIRSVGVTYHIDLVHTYMGSLFENIIYLHHKYCKLALMYKQLNLEYSAPYKIELGNKYIHHDTCHAFTGVTQEK